MGSKIRKRLCFLCLSLIFLCSGCVTTSSLEVRLRLAELEDRVLQLEATGVGAPTYMYGRDCQRSTDCAKSLDSITDASLVDGYLAFVVDEDRGLYIYQFDDNSTSAEDYPRIIQPNDAGGNGDWILISSVNTHVDAGDGAGALTLYEDYTNGTNWYRMTAPTSIASNTTFNMGEWNISSLLVDPVSNIDLEVYHTKTLFIVEEDGLSANRTATLPPATGSGVVFAFLFYQDGSTYEVFIDPDGTDQIIYTSAAGDYVYGENAAAYSEGSILYLYDCMSGIWCPEFYDSDMDFSAAGTWQEQ